MGQKLTTLDILEQFKHRFDNGEYYDYSLVEYKDSRSHIKIICPKHGVFEQTINQHRNNKPCTRCMRETSRKLTKQIFLERISKSRLDKGEYYDYSLVPELIGNNKCKIPIICPIHGEFNQFVLDHTRNSNCSKCGDIQRKKTNIVKYGIECPFQDSEWMKDSLNLKYGVENVSQLDFIKLKKQETCFRNFGVKNPFESAEIQAKSRISVLEKYGVENVSLSESIKNRIKITNLEKYGTENVFASASIKDRIKITNLERYGVDNPAKSPDIKNKIEHIILDIYGVDSEDSYHIRLKDAYRNRFNASLESRKLKSIAKYGCEYPSQSKEVIQKGIDTKIRNNSFCKINFSEEARLYFVEYMKTKNYSLSQVAFCDPDNNLYEWGYKIDSSWVLFDFVAFEDGFRGNKNHIIEIIEYHGPFHYNETDVELRPDDKAYPWKSKTKTIKESYEIDQIKKTFALSLTPNFSVVWAEKYHKQKSLEG